MSKQFSEVSRQYGAPMGRRSYGLPAHTEGDGRTIRLFKVALDSGGYDDGGAYWGIGAPLFCATDDADYRQFTRANSRFDACALLEIPPGRLMLPLRAFDPRYTTAREFCGADSPRYVPRFCGEVINQRFEETREGALAVCLEHRREFLESIRGRKHG